MACDSASVSSVTTLAAALLLIPVLGLIGAAIASAVGLALQNVLMVMAVRRYAGVRVDVYPARASSSPDG